MKIDGRLRYRGGIIGSMAMTLRLSEEQTEALRETAEREGRSMQEVALQAVDEYTAARARTFEVLLDGVLRDHADVLRRLGEA